MKILKRKKNPQANEEKHDKLFTTLYAIIAILLGLMLFGSVAVIQFQINCGVLSENDAVFTVLKVLLENIGSVLVVAGIGSIFLEYYAFVKYMKGRIKDVIIENDYLDKLDVQIKKQLKLRLEKSIYYPNVDLHEDSYFYVVQNLTSPLIGSYYYKEYVISVDCSLLRQNDQEYIAKRVYKRIIFSQLDKMNAVQVLENLPNIYFQSIRGKEDSELFQLKKLVFTKSAADCPHPKCMSAKRLQYGENADQVTYRIDCDRVIRYREETEDDIYDRVVEFDFHEFQKKLSFQHDATLEMEYETVAPVSDYLFFNRINKPCEQYCIHFNYDKADFDVDGIGFGFMQYAEHDRVGYREQSNGKVIRFKDWILPGDGTIFTIIRKH